MSVFSEFLSYAAFLRGLPAFLRERVTIEQARQIVRDRLANREANFLDWVERAVYSDPQNPYHRLLRLAGYSLADLRTLVRAEGLEPSLGKLREAGVYVTFEEFKGLRPIERGGKAIETGPTSFDNPSFRRHFPVTTGGSTGPPRRVLMDLDFLYSRLSSQLIMAHAHGLLGAPLVQWAEIPPGHGLEAALLQVAHGAVPVRWFTSFYPAAAGAGLRFRLATELAVAVARRCDAPLPRPEFLPFERADVIAIWAKEALRTHDRCVIRAHVSNALRVALAAEERGIDLKGVTFSSGGEPATAAKVERITRTGARFLPNYFLMEAGPVGFGCATGGDPGDQHLLSDHLALITCPREVLGSDAEVNAFYLTTLLSTAPKLMLNVETDDCGEVEERTCGCPLGALGFATHLRQIRSFGKLVGESVTLLANHMERILEHELPARFGGSPLDYQLLEDEDGNGFTRLTLLVDPRLEIEDEDEIIAAVHTELRRAGGAAAFSESIWSRTGILRVIREPPRPSPRGKQWILRTTEGAGTKCAGAAATAPGPSSDGMRPGP